jgi:putative acetyltransferase
LHVSYESPDQAEVVALISELDAYQDTLYPPESRHLLDLHALKQANVIFAVARCEDGHAVGCGAVVVGPDYGEIKRMYVLPAYRGRGVARLIFDRLESEARARACRVLTLETGPYQPQAIAFYKRSGFEQCGPFGVYADDPLSVFMRKTLDGV